MLIATSGWWIGSIIFFIVWVLIAFWPARVAARKGHSFLLYFLFSLVFFPAATSVILVRAAETTRWLASRSMSAGTGTRASSTPPDQRGAG